MEERIYRAMLALAEKKGLDRADFTGSNVHGGEDPLSEESAGLIFDGIRQAAIHVAALNFVLEEFDRDDIFALIAAWCEAKEWEFPLPSWAEEIPEVAEREGWEVVA